MKHHGKLACYDVLERFGMSEIGGWFNVKTEEFKRCKEFIYIVGVKKDSFLRRRLGKRSRVAYIKVRKIQSNLHVGVEWKLAVTYYFCIVHLLGNWELLFEHVWGQLVDATISE